MTSECHCPTELEPFLMIEYPGFIKNLDKAMDTLGGLDTVDRIYKSEKDRLELKFRRSDPLSHPAYGDRVAKKGLVIRIRRRKGKGNQADEDQFSINVIGKVQTVYCFDTLAEFQWLPMQRTNLKEVLKIKDLDEGVTIKRSSESINPEYASILDDILPVRDPFDNTLKTFNPDAPLLILPAIFSRFDTPRDVHQYQPKFRSKEMSDEFNRQQRLNIIGRTRKKRSTMTYLLNFGDTIPESAPEKLIKEREGLSNFEHSLVPQMRDCFARQKVWSKAALCRELNCTFPDVKYTLPLVAYHWLTGPFRTMWVEYGYDPHKDRGSKPLQTLDFRIKNPLDQQEYSRRSMHQYQLPMRKNPEVRAKKQLDLKHLITNRQLDESLEADKKQITESMCKFRRGTIPPARQLSYQLKDIELDEVQVIVHSNDGREPDVCSKRDGWLPDNSIDEIRKLMVKSLKQTIEAMSQRLVDE